MGGKKFNNLRCSCAHLLAAAVLELYPDVKAVSGSFTENGFYYDFDLSGKKISEKDLPQIEKKMHQIVKSWKKIQEKVVNSKVAVKIFKNNSYKLKLIKKTEKKKRGINLFQSGNFIDLCPHSHINLLDKNLKYFKLLSIAGAYWQNNEKNKMLTRIYGTIFSTKGGLTQYLWQIEENKKRDHRKLGEDLNLFVFSDIIGKGLPMFTSKGAIIYRILERFIVDEEIKRGYQHVITPPLAKVDLYKISGHYPFYKDTMYPTMKIDEEELILRPMTCPHHFMLYKSKPHSYHEMPIRIAEISPQFRYEKSGELSGLIRVRMFTLADAHIITPIRQVEQEIIEVLKLIDFVNKSLGFKKGKDYFYRLSLGNRSDNKKYFKDDEAWEKAEKILKNVLNKLKAPYYEAKNEAAFYGPKIDIQMKNIYGKEETAFTVQYDFVMPKRFNLTFINEKGEKEEPIVIHRSSLGCFERTIAFLIEHYSGAFPLWLAPIQVIIIPLNNKNNKIEKYSNEVLQKLEKNNIRTQIDRSNNTLSYKIRNAELNKIPYIVVLGNKEIETNTLSIRKRGTREILQQITLHNFLKFINKKIKTKAFL